MNASPADVIASIKPGESVEVCTGLEVTRLPISGFMRARVHYTVRPERRGTAWPKAASARYGPLGTKSWKWRREQEIDFSASSGEPVFANWSREVHVIPEFKVPQGWPKWLMYDVGGVNPHALTWVTMDPTPPDFPIYVYREWYKGLEMPDGSQGSYFVAADVVRVAFELSLLQSGAPEALNALIIDPAARASAARTGSRGNERGDTIFEQVDEVVRALGWNVPVISGNNLKDEAIDMLIDRIGNFPLYELGHDGSVKASEDGEPLVQRTALGTPVIVKPRFFVFDSCQWTSWELGVYRWRDWSSDKAAEGANRPEAPVDKDDHHVTNLIRLMNHVARDPDLGIGPTEPTPETDPSSRVVKHWRRKLRERHRLGDGQT